MTNIITININRVPLETDYYAIPILRVEATLEFMNKAPLLELVIVFLKNSN